MKDKKSLTENNLHPIKHDSARFRVQISSQNGEALYRHPMGEKPLKQK